MVQKEESPIKLLVKDCDALKKKVILNSIQIIFSDILFFIQHKHV